MAMICGCARWRMLRIAFSMLSRPPITVVASFIAVVCSGIASLKWRTSSTRPKEVQPWLPCITGMHEARPMNA
jgi:hypothetical protein